MLNRLSEVRWVRGLLQMVWPPEVEVVAQRLRLGVRMEQQSLSWERAGALQQELEPRSKQEQKQVAVRA